MTLQLENYDLAQLPVKVMAGGKTGLQRNAAVISQRYEEENHLLTRPPEDPRSS